MEKKPETIPQIHAAAAQLGRLGGLARAQRLTPEQLSKIARRAGKASAQVRWKKEK